MILWVTHNHLQITQPLSAIMYFCQSVRSCWKPSEKIFFIAAITHNFLNSWNGVLGNHLPSSHCSFIVHLPQHVQCFCRRFCQMLAEFSYSHAVLQRYFFLYEHQTNDYRSLTWLKNSALWMYLFLTTYHVPCASAPQ